MVIRAENVSMCYRMAFDRVKSLKEYLVQMAKGKVQYEEFWALRDVSFEVKKGEVLGIIGHNGAGKSTLLKVISGILKPTNGSVTVQGTIVPMLELGSGFDYDLTGRENIFLNGAILGYSEEFLKDKYNEIVSFSELGQFIDVPLRNYSSGMVMRLAFSIATVVNPDILIVDEILAVGDADFQAKSKARMLELMSGGTTVLFVSHSIDQIQEMCNRVLWLENGRKIMLGRTFDVCNAYRNSQNSGHSENERKLKTVINDFCWVCGKTEDFRVEPDVVLFREGMCECCGSSIRVSDIYHVLLESIGLDNEPLQNAVQNEQFQKYTILSSSDSGAAYSCLKQLPNLHVFHGTDSKRLEQLYSIDAPNAFFDIVIIEEILAYAERPEEIFDELHRVIKKDGLLLITVPIHEGRRSISRLHNPRKVYRGDGMLVCMDWGDDITKHLGKHGFKSELRKIHSFFRKDEITNVDKSYEDYLNKHPFSYYKYNSVVVVARAV